MKPKTEEELEAERLAAEEAAAKAEEEKNIGTQRSKQVSQMSKLIHNPDDPMNILEGNIEEEDRMGSDGNIKALDAVEGEGEDKQ